MKLNFVVPVRTMISKNIELSLTPLSMEHKTSTFKWIQDDCLKRMFLLTRQITWQDHNNFFDTINKDDTQRIFAILANNQHIGNCGFKNIDFKKQEAELWIYIGEQLLQKKGIGFAATTMLINYGISVLELKNIYLHVADFNDAARKLYKKLNFIETYLIDSVDQWSNHTTKIIRMELTSSIWMSQ